jgi:signal transduction histidine kinase
MSTTGLVGTAPPDRLRRLRQFALADAATAFAGAALALATSMYLVPSPYLLVIAGMCAVSGLVMLGALLPLRRGDVRGGLLWLTAANWVIALAAAAITTFVWPLMILAALLPAVLAPTVVGNVGLRQFVIPSIAIAFAVAVLGLYQDFSGVSDEAPDWLKNLVLVVCVPVFGAFIALIGLQHALHLHTALDEAIEAKNEVAQQADELARSRARIVMAADRERHRIERDLHDGAQQRLIALRIKLRQAARGNSGNGAIDDDVLADLLGDLKVAHDELRSLAQGLSPPVLSEHGIAEALRSAADRCTLPVTTQLPDVGRFSAEIETAIYFCCLEAMQNAVKHAGAEHVRLELGSDRSSVWFEVADDGAGFDPSEPVAGSGLINMKDRLGAAGGTLELRSRPGAGSLVCGRIPVA